MPAPTPRRRPVPLLAVLLTGAHVLPALPALADQIAAQASVAAVTVYPSGAMVTRRVEMTVPPGLHDIVLPGLPEGTDPDSLRVAATGARLGSVSLQQGRALPDEAADSPAVLAAREEVRAKERALRERDAKVAAIRAEAKAAEDTIAFLMALAASDGATGGDVAALAATVQAQILEARRTAIWAEDAARSAEVGREDDVRALEAARARLEALQVRPAGAETLVITLDVPGNAPAPFALDITSSTGNAGWRPVYDLRLDRKAGTLAVDRGVLVSQHTGEDWPEARLRLSSARPGEQAAPTEVPSDFPRTEPQMQLERGEFAAAPAAPAAMAEKSAARLDDAAGGGAMTATDLGLSVVYDYPAPVSIRDGVDALRLPLDQKSLTPAIFAEAAPRFDSTAYLMAEGENGTGEPLLPGRASLFADGVMVGQADLPLIARGDKLRLGFGPIEGILAERRVPQRQEGEGGLIRRQNEDDETAILRIENLTGEAWPLRVVDRVPVSEQKALGVDWSADPAPSETDPDGRRGILRWAFDLPPGEVREITLNVRLRWPEGEALIR